jgi:hypothetical protein
MAFHFLRNPRKSIYGEKYTKDHYLSFVFFATCSPTHAPSFVIPTTIPNTTYHTVLKASPGTAIFGRDMLFDIPLMADWQKIGE